MYSELEVVIMNMIYGEVVLIRFKLGFFITVLVMGAALARGGVRVTLLNYIKVYRYIRVMPMKCENPRS